ncbi:MAG TPA: tRNA-intron lyase [Methanomicrobia archaeon]|nr:tRNA-intron lyase [Methanomicrobia archaeon]
MNGVLSGDRIVLAAADAEGHEQKGFKEPRSHSGRRATPERTISLSLEEAAYLLETGKLQIMANEAEGVALTLEEFFLYAREIQPNFSARYIVFRDLRERGYVVQPGEREFLLFPRGTKPGVKAARHFIRIFSERECLAAKEILQLLQRAQNMRKEPIIAVVDDESDVTYYEVRELPLEWGEKREAREGIAGPEKEGGAISLLEDKVVVWDTQLAEHLHVTAFYGNLTKEKRLLLSLIEAAYLIRTGVLAADSEQFGAHAALVDREFQSKYQIYADLRDRGLVPKTGYKFGTHFRVYRGAQQTHSTELIHVLPETHVFSLPALARAVRLAHGVKKRMIFAFIAGERRLYVGVGRKKL